MECAFIERNHNISLQVVQKKKGHALDVDASINLRVDSLRKEHVLLQVIRAHIEQLSKVDLSASKEP